ncbi:MAG: nucleotidyltransferase family protein [Chloroflexi bacterium]|nr:nucleotidyltransferase family protein [Chloroflexota bacterium]
MTVDTEALRLLLSLAAPEDYGSTARVPYALEKGLVKRVVRLAKANGLFYCVARGINTQEQDLSFLKEALAQEERKRQAYLETIRLLNDIEARHGIRFMLIKACTSVPHVPRDIDIFVSPMEKSSFSQALKDSGFKCVYDSPAESSYASPGHMELDIYTSIIYAHKTFFDEDFLWQAKTIEEKDGLKYPALQPYANYPLILVHSLFGHRVMSLLDFLQLQYLRRSMQPDASRDYAYLMGWGKVFDIAVERLDVIEKMVSARSPGISFPLLFDQRFVMACFAKLGDGGEDEFHASLSLRLSLFIDRLVHELRKSPFYEPLERLKFPGRVATNLGLIVRRLRGDRKA